MYKVLRADKDIYITDRVINGIRSYESNTGVGGTIDIFKLYGMTTSLSGSTKVPNTELSRALLHFDLSPLLSLSSSNSIDISDPSFSCHVKLFDVYGGQPTPRNFTVVLNPLSKSFDEGIGKDVVFYSDHSICNFMTASWSSISGSDTWILSGAASGGSWTSTVDYITSIPTGSSTYTQTFIDGTEDLYINVTETVKSVIKDEIPDSGFRLALHSSHESDVRSYFVKRFSSRHAFDESKHPQLIVKFDDSIISDQEMLELDSSSDLFMFNRRRGVLSNIFSGSSELTGSNIAILKIRHNVVSGSVFYFSASLHSTGIYGSTVLLPSTNVVLNNNIIASGSVVLDQEWKSTDLTVSYFTGSLVLNPPDRGNTMTCDVKYSMAVSGLMNDHRNDEIVDIRLHIFDVSRQFTKAVKTLIDSPGLVVRDVHYSIRDYMTGNVVIPFDTVGNSTRLSADSRGMFTSIDMSNLTSGRAYVLDFMVDRQSQTKIYDSIAFFRVTKDQK